MNATLEEIEACIKAAADAYNAGEYTTIASAARAYHAPAQRVSRRLRGIPSASARGGHNKALNDDQEHTLCMHIRQYEELKLPLTLRLIHETATLILRSDDLAVNEERVLSKDWARRFMIRHPEFAIRKKTKKPLGEDRPGERRTT